MAVERLLDLLSDVEDPRCNGKVEHWLTDILVIAVCAVIACAESWDDRAHRVVADHFNQTCPGRGAPPAGLEALRCWPGLRAVLAIETICSINGSAKKVAELRYFLTSGPDAPEVLARAIRKHWTIKNNLHWVLDVPFREDESRVRDRIAAPNLAVLRKIALNLISRNQSSKISKRGRRKQAA